MIRVYYFCQTNFQLLDEPLRASSSFLELPVDSDESVRNIADIPQRQIIRHLVEGMRKPNVTSRVVEYLAASPRLIDLPGYRSP